KTLVQTPDGSWYGSVAPNGGDCGWIFRFDPATATAPFVKSLDPDVDGCITRGMTVAADGNLYGITAVGGTASRGTIFKIDATGAFSVVANLDSNPASTLTPAPDGRLYAAVHVVPGGSGGGLLRFDPASGSANVVATLPLWGGTTNNEALLVGLDGRIYGTTSPTQETRFLNQIRTVYAFGMIDGLPVAPAAGTYGGTTTLSTRLLALGVPLAGRSIDFALNGVSVGSATTDSSGVATLSGVSLGGLNAGSYAGAVAASFAGD